jgi:hypothetical protein
MPRFAIDADKGVARLKLAFVAVVDMALSMEFFISVLQMVTLVISIWY